MAYHFKKTAPFEDDIDLADEAGNVVKTIHVSVCLDNMLGKYREIVNDLHAAEAFVSADDAKSLEMYGEIVMRLLRLVFKDDADVILQHYDGHYLAMLEQVLPYIQNVIGPELRGVSRRRMDALKNAKK